ncbi:DUF1810 domain-containing protein [Dactylosporangium aurantiacum]|uniref:DUF1810 domain-containing protein n=1 Tax=Dactylosporangium aurantiacum TaxID=35754 RepID=A0A9Q9IBQ0_9ACTN|nr:DUF1810 domain-containing protein [Dactylosporangium aurantiacum]MDG6107161.1 DUF1810 domain-containing protein [Dactylosporangium aurantiacum]UWZ51455.1 DUF1810 domain-containing protein [Dactylosporangium aurantiacum]
MEDPYDLARFVDAQAGTYDDALEELRRGRKRGHWMWFVFPQIAGLGSSPTAQRYAIGSLDEARAYLQHPVLGPRLHECAEAMLGNTEATAQQVLGEVDAMKLRSSMTLFQLAAPEESVFGRVIARFFEGAPDGETIRRA